MDHSIQMMVLQRLQTKGVFRTLEKQPFLLHMSVLCDKRLIILHLKIANRAQQLRNPFVKPVKTELHGPEKQKNGMAYTLGQSFLTKKQLKKIEQQTMPRDYMLGVGTIEIQPTLFSMVQPTWEVQDSHHCKLLLGLCTSYTSSNFSDLPTRTPES